MFEHQRMIAAGAVNVMKRAVGIVSRPVAVSYNKNRAHEAKLLDPTRVRTPAELEKIAAAQAKRDLRAAKRRREQP